jgi:hypothetical protein
MKKLVILLLLCPMFINAACDRELQSTYASYAKDISYETEYSKSQNKFTVKLYNVIDDMTVKFNKKNYSIKDNEVVIDNIKEGTHMEIYIYGKDGCIEPARTIYIDQPYYNEFFESSICHGYENKITYCTHKFTDIDVTEKLVKTAIENYEHNMVQVVVPPEEPVLTTMQKISMFAKTWGIRIILVLVTSFLTNWYFNDKYIKVKHKL